MNMLGEFAGLRIVWTEMALQETTERLFPASKHRSKRIRKKLIKRFGGEFRHRPCMFRTGQTLIIHPALRADFERAIAAQK